LGQFGTRHVLLFIRKPWGKDSPYKEEITAMRTPEFVAACIIAGNDS
jgi:hypothetical protein